jgi:C4-dicarboxylate-specific signal transduction histidine kinase
MALEITRRERQLRELQMQLAHTNRVVTMGQLTASITHEVNQPIAPRRSTEEHATKPSRTGSSPLLKTIGIVLVAARAAGIEGLFAKITLTRRFTKSAASGAARYADRILRGDKASELPVQLPVKYLMIINLQTAKALGLAVPPALLVTAGIAARTTSL